jgi:DNA-binding PadR family transcriptional regulator
MFGACHRYVFTPAFAGEAILFASRGFKGSASRGNKGGCRTRRGDIKFLLLALLAEQPRHGYDLIREVESRYGGFRRLSPGSVYPTLQLLEEGGYLTSEQVEGKRVYTITEKGQELLAGRTQQFGGATPSDDYYNPIAESSPELIELRTALSQLTEAIAQMGSSGNSEQIKRVRGLLTDTKSV